MVLNQFLINKTKCFKCVFEFENLAQAKLISQIWNYGLIVRECTTVLEKMKGIHSFTRVEVVFIFDKQMLKVKALLPD